jgi:hypothetical protein
MNGVFHAISEDQVTCRKRSRQAALEKARVMKADALGPKDNQGIFSLGIAHILAFVRAYLPSCPLEMIQATAKR